MEWDGRLFELEEKFLGDVRNVSFDHFSCRHAGPFLDFENELGQISNQVSVNGKRECLGTLRVCGDEETAPVGNIISLWAPERGLQISVGKRSFSESKDITPERYWIF